MSLLGDLRVWWALRRLERALRRMQAARVAYLKRHLALIKQQQADVQGAIDLLRSRFDL